MTAHVLYPARALLRIVRRARASKPTAPDPLFAMLDGLDVPPHLIGRHIDIHDQDGKVVATTRRQHTGKIGAMIG